MIYLLREQQKQAFADYMHDNFVQRMTVHLRQKFPQQSAELEDKAWVELIQQGIAQAERYQIIRECDVERYLELMFLLGFDFDRRWAHLLKKRDWEASMKLEVLYAKYKAHPKG